MVTTCVVRAPPCTIRACVDVDLPNLVYKYFHAHVLEFSFVVVGLLSHTYALSLFDFFYLPIVSSGVVSQRPGRDDDRRTCF